MIPKGSPQITYIQKYPTGRKYKRKYLTGRKYIRNYSTGWEYIRKYTTGRKLTFFSPAEKKKPFCPTDLNSRIILWLLLTEIYIVAGELFQILGSSTPLNRCYGLHARTDDEQAETGSRPSMHHMCSFRFKFSLQTKEIILLTLF